MTKRPAAYHRPDNLEDALRLLAEPGARPLGGGTKLLAGNVGGAVVDLQDLGLNGIETSGRTLTIGAMTRLADLEAFLLEQGGEQDGDEDLPAAGLLRQAAHRAGPNTYRNAATIGGSTAARLPDSELLVALLLFNAELSLRRDGAERIGLSDYLAAAERPAGLILSMALEWKAGCGRAARVARTPADDPIVSVMVWRPKGGAVRLAASGLSARPMRLAEAEAQVAGGVTAESIRAAGAAARAAASHEGDFRGDPSYRAEMGAVLTHRLLSALDSDRGQC